MTDDEKNTVWLVLDKGGMVDYRHLFGIFTTEKAALQYIDRNYAGSVAQDGINSWFFIEETEVVGEQE